MFLDFLFGIPPFNYIYQLFFNILVLVYEGLAEFVADPDMGVAVIVLALIVRFFMLPVTLRSRANNEDKEEIGRRYAELKRRFKDSDPIRYMEEKKKLVKAEKSTIRSEMLNLAIQVLIALILFKIFATGIKGSDLPLLYSWVPEPELPFNLVFMDTIDLTKPSLQLNIITSVLLFIVEFLHNTFSPFEPSKSDRLMQYIVPIGVFVYLYTMPAGKKLFFIASLAFSIVLMLILEGRDLIMLSRSQ